MRSLFGHRYIVHALFSLAALACVVIERVHLDYLEAGYCRMRDVLIAPFNYLLQTSPAAAALTILPRFKAIYFTVISLLKPVYRESYDTKGLSLHSL